MRKPRHFFLLDKHILCVAYMHIYIYPIHALLFTVLCNKSLVKFLFPGILSLFSVLNFTDCISCWHLFLMVHLSLYHYITYNIYTVLFCLIWVKQIIAEPQKVTTTYEMCGYICSALRLWISQMCFAKNGLISVINTQLSMMPEIL